MEIIHTVRTVVTYTLEEIDVLVLSQALPRGNRPHDNVFAIKYLRLRFKLGLKEAMNLWNESVKPGLSIEQQTAVGRPYLAQEPVTLGSLLRANFAQCGQM